MRMRRADRRLLAAVLMHALLGAGSLQAQRPGPKIYISVDMEGIAGVVTAEQLGPTGFEYQRFREFMTAEALAAVEAARAAGAGEIVVSDSHGNAQNLLIERFPPDVTVVRAFPRPLGMMEGIDSTFDAAIFIGYHASAASPVGVRAHTLSSANYAGVALNGVPVPEGGINAAIAGHFGVPVVMVSGDDAAVEEMRRLIGGVEGAVVKRALGFHSAATMTPQAAQALIRERVTAALARRAPLRPHRLQTPVRLDLTFKNYRPAEVLALLPNVERTDSHSVRFVGRDILEVARFLTFVGAFEPGLAP
jgi:D-amino peptidase